MTTFIKVRLGCGATFKTHQKNLKDLTLLIRLRSNQNYSLCKYCNYVNMLNTQFYPNFEGNVNKMFGQLINDFRKATRRSKFRFKYFNNLEMTWGKYKSDQRSDIQKIVERARKALKYLTFEKENLERSIKVTLCRWKTDVRWWTKRSTKSNTLEISWDTKSRLLLFLALS